MSLTLEKKLTIQCIKNDQQDATLSYFVERDVLERSPRGISEWFKERGNEIEEKAQKFKEKMKELREKMRQKGEEMKEWIKEQGGKENVSLKIRANIVEPHKPIRWTPFQTDQSNGL